MFIVYSFIYFVRLMDTADKDLGLAVIERWTYAFIQGYERSKKKAQYTTTLYDIMVAPFAGNKNALGANIGIKEDTSQRKFKDIKVEEFFGERPSNKKRPNKKKADQQPTITTIKSIEEMITLPSSPPLWDTSTFPRNLHSTNFDNNRSNFESPSTTTSTTQVPCSTQHHPRLLTLVELDCYYLSSFSQQYSKRNSSRKRKCEPIFV